MLFFFFFQAEDGIRDKLVTGVQTCALPILAGRKHRLGGGGGCPRRNTVQAAKQPARGGARRERDRAGEDQPALVVPPRWRWRRLAGKTRPEITTWVAGPAGETRSGHIALPVLRMVWVVSLAHGSRPQLAAAVRHRPFVTF